ncbi:MAG: hypothetical protein M0020_11300 [Actinomycetota bacterium]|nr:hypothetical protein [Actinomycetota bacterium]
MEKATELDDGGAPQSVGAFQFVLQNMPTKAGPAPTAVYVADAEVPVVRSLTVAVAGLAAVAVVTTALPGAIETASGVNGHEKVLGFGHRKSQLMAMRSP